MRQAGCGGDAKRTRQRCKLRAALFLMCAGVGALGLAGCASKVIEPAAGLPPRYPDLLYPTVPDGTGSPDAVALLERGWRFLQAGDLQSAERAFSLALKSSPSFYPAETGLGYVRLTNRAYDAALGAFDAVLKRSDAYVPALVGRGDALLGASRAREAIGSFERALARDPSLAEVRRRVEVVRLRLLQDALGGARRAAEAGDYAAARRAYQEAIDASPDSAFLYRDLAGVERLAGDIDAALGHLKKAADLDPSDAGTWIQMGDLLESRQDFEAAGAAYATAEQLEPGGAATERLGKIKRRAALANLPVELQRVAELGQATRGDLAALLGTRLTRLIEQAPQREAVVITDIGGHWAAAWIHEVTRAGFMDVYSNHEFQPGMPLRRADLAVVASRVLQIIGMAQPQRFQEWQRGRPAIADVEPGNLNYAAAALVVTAGVMPLLDGGAFLPARPASGAEALDVLGRLEVLSR
jgi:tetratricopeptide (TPR) repeat protein